MEPLALLGAAWSEEEAAAAAVLAIAFKEVASRKIKAAASAVHANPVRGQADSARAVREGCSA
jgi:hypothetical protein